MKKILATLAILSIVLVASVSMAQWPIDRNTTKIGNMNYNGYSLTNALTIGFADGTILYSTSTVVAASTTNAAIVVGTLPLATVSNSIINKAFWKALPTSTNGLVSGQLWLNSNVLTIYP